LLRRLESPEPRRSRVEASLVLIDDLEARITQIAKELRPLGRRSPLHPAAFDRAGVRMDHIVHGRVRDRRDRSVRFAGEAHRLYRPVSARQAVRPERPPRPAVQAWPQVSALGADGGSDRRLLAPALSRALPANQASGWSPAGPKVAQIDLARRLSEAIWYMLTRNKPFAPEGAICRLAA